MSALVGQSIALGISLVWEMDRRALQRGTSRSVEVARYVERALDAKRLLQTRPDRYLDDAARGPGRATIWASEELWSQVSATSYRLSCSHSEAVRVLVHAGLALSSPEPDVEPPEVLRARALAALREPRTADELARALWPSSPDPGVLRGCVRRLLLSLDAEGLLERRPRGWRRPARWSAAPSPAEPA